MQVGDESGADGLDELLRQVDDQDEVHALMEVGILLHLLAEREVGGEDLWVELVVEVGELYQIP